MRVCPNCGARVEDHHINCPHCYAELLPPKGREEAPPRDEPFIPPYTAPPYRDRAPDRPRKDPTIALLLAIVPGLFGLWGLGHIYLGRTQRGVQLLITGIVITVLLMATYYTWFLIFTLVCMVILALAWFLLFVFQCYEAYVLARLS